MNRVPKPGEFYRHFKNNLYQVIAIAKHTETKEMMVVYQALYKDFRVFVRPLSLFMGEVDHEKYPECVQKYRFQKVNLEDGVENNEGPCDCGEQKKSKEESAVAVEEKTVSDAEQNADASKINPDLMAFLDADTYAKKIEVLVKIKKNLTEELIQTIAISLDYPLGEGDLADQYESVLYYLETHARYEGNRLR